MYQSGMSGQMHVPVWYKWSDGQMHVLVWYEWSDACTGLV